MSDVQRLSRLLIAACLAYIWIVYLGSVSPPYTFSLLNGDIELNRDWQLFV
jgi:hypothetical protein